MRRLFVSIAAASILFGAVSLVAARRQHDAAETVMITLRPRTGAETELAKVIARHWEVARRLDLVKPEPHLTLRSRDESGNPTFIDIFTWRDEETPDNAPAEIRAVWDDMNRLTETRGGKGGLAIERVTLVGE